MQFRESSERRTFDKITRGMIDKRYVERYNIYAQFLNAVQRCRKGQQIVERWPQQALRSRCLALRFAELFLF